MRANGAPDTQALRSWQRRALVRYLAAQPRDFLAVATPGSGKTAFALRVAGELLADGAVEQITVVVPTEHLKTQWALAAARVGIALDPKFSNSAAHTSSEYHGVVVTYAQVASHPTRHRVRTENRRTLVVFDEIHHGGDAKSWGDAIREAFDDATRRLALTGTPFRSDDSAIPFVTYAPDADGLMRSTADHTYGYAEALADGVVRPVVFLAYSGEARWRTSAGEEHAARLGEPLNAEQTARAWRTVLDAKGEWIPAVLQAADTRLTQKRNGGVPDAGAMVIASDQKAARAYAAVLTKLTGETPTVVLSDDPDRRHASRNSARAPAAGSSRSGWCPRGSTCPGLLSASTPPVHRHRCSSRRRSAVTCGRGSPARPRASSCRRFRRCSTSPARWRHSATTCSASRTARNRASTTRRSRTRHRRRPRPTRTRASSRSARTPNSIRSSSTARRSARRHRRAATRKPTTSASPACSTPMRCETCCGAGRKRRSRSAQRRARCRRLSTHGQLRELRSQLNTLVSVAHHRTGKPHGWIHKELRRICGGPPMAAATSDQLKARIEAVRELRT